MLDPGIKILGWGDDASTAAGNNNDRVGDDKAIAMRGGNLFLLGNPATGTSETVGTLAIGAGHSVIDVRYSDHTKPYVGPAIGNWISLSNYQFERRSTLSGTNAAELVFGSINRGADNGQIAIRGQSLGVAGGASASRIMVTAAPLLIGGDGSTLLNQKIVPYLYTGGDLQTGNSLVTWDATKGLRALDTTTEFDAFSVGAFTTNNTKITAVTTAVTTATTVNSLMIVISGGAQTVSGTAPITVTSGVVMIQGDAGDGWGYNLSAPLDFAGNEGHIYAMNDLYGGGTRSPHHQPHLQHRRQGAEHLAPHGLPGH